MRRKRTVFAHPRSRIRALNLPCGFCVPWECSRPLVVHGGPILANETGGIVNPSNFRNRSFKRILKQVNLPDDTRFHDLRHTCATLLLSRNVNPKIVSEMLGHANIAIALGTYSYALSDMQEKAAKALEEALR